MRRLNFGFRHVIAFYHQLNDTSFFSDYLQVSQQTPSHIVGTCTCDCRTERKSSEIDEVARVAVQSLLA